MVAHATVRCPSQSIPQSSTPPAGEVAADFELLPWADPYIVQLVREHEVAAAAIPESQVVYRRVRVQRSVAAAVAS